MSIRKKNIDKDLEECKKQIEISIDYFNGVKKLPKRNALKSDSASTKLKASNTRSRNEEKGKTICKKYNSNNPVYKQSDSANGLKSESVVQKGFKKTNYATSTYKRLSNQKESFQVKSKYNNKENDLK